jgi:ribokinase
MPVGSIEEVKDAGKHLVEKGLRQVIVTLGERGALFLTEDREFLCPATRVDSRDSTGAGDAFIGCFAAYYVETGEITKAIEYAGKYAALSTMRPGTQKSFLDRKGFEAATGDGALHPSV